LNGIAKERICLSLKPQNLKKRSGKHQKQTNDKLVNKRRTLLPKKLLKLSCSLFGSAKVVQKHGKHKRLGVENAICVKFLDKNFV